LTLPWLWAVDFFGTASGLPRAGGLLDLPGDLLIYPRQNWAYIAAAAVPWTLALLRRPAHRGTWDALVLLTATPIVGWLAFSLLMPAVSFAPRRMTMMLAVPTLLLIALAVPLGLSLLARRSAEPSRPGPPVWSRWLVVGGIALAALVLRPWYTPHVMTLDDRWLAEVLDDHFTVQTLEALAESGVTSDDRVYASPNAHLTLMFYGGLPVQSLAPLRPEYVRDFPGDLIVAERHSELFPMGWSEIDELLAESLDRPVTLDDWDRQRWWSDFYRWQNRQSIHRYLVAAGVTAEPEFVMPSPLAPVDFRDWLPTAERANRDRMDHYFRTLNSGGLLARRYPVTGQRDWWRVYFAGFTPEVTPQQIPEPVWVPRLLADAERLTVHALKHGAMVLHFRSPADAHALSPLTPRD
jgi:hypothetical protein